MPILVEKDVFKSVVMEGNTRVDEGNDIEFVIESTGERKEGRLTKISGKKEKTIFQIIPKGSEHEELWCVSVMADGTLKVIS